MIKPFRFISSDEMADFNRHFMQEIEAWNQGYALFPLAFTLELPSHDDAAHDGLAIFSDDKLCAIIEKQHEEVFNHILFGENQRCFNSISHEMVLILFNRLLKTDECRIIENRSLASNWCYRGSTCLVLTLSAEQHRVKIMLSPDWVYQNLPSHPITSHHLCTLDEALAEETLDVTVSLLPVHLPIEQLLAIEVGDVLVTDHSLATPLRVVHHDQVLAHVELGQSMQQKSILLVPQVRHPERVFLREGSP